MSLWEDYVLIPKLCEVQKFHLEAQRHKSNMVNIYCWGLPLTWLDHEVSSHFHLKALNQAFIMIIFPPSKKSQQTH